MPEIPYVEDVKTARVRIVRWPAMANGDTGKPYAVSSWYPDKCAEVDGTPGTGGKVVIQGTSLFADPALRSQPDTTKFKPLTDPQGNALDIISTDPQIEQVLENPYWIRPAITAGDGTTSLTVVLTFKG